VTAAAPGSRPTRLLARLAGGCVTVLTWVTVAAIALAVGLFLWLRHTMAVPAAPDPAAFARSYATRHADANDSKWIDQQFAQLTLLAPQLTSSGRSVFDVCSVSGSAGGPFGGGTGYAFTCKRTDTRYYAWGGPSAGGVRQLEQALRRLGWGMFTPVSPAAGAPAALSVVDASLLTTTSALLIGKTGLDFSWAQRGINLAGAIRAVPPVVAPQRNTYIAVQRPSPKEILSHLTANSPDLLILSFSVTYAQQSAAP
jgi:hypothetical protein